MIQELNSHRLSSVRGRLLAGTAAAALLAASATMAHAQSLPTGGTVVGGSAAITYTSPTQMQITAATNRSAINWQSFSIAHGYGVNVKQPNTTSTQLENVTGPSPSQIFGALSSNGRIVLANPNGIWFGPDAQVDVAGLVATTSHPTQSDINTFINGGSLTMSQAGNANAAIVNQGTITIAQEGLAAFVAPGVSNQGVIQARLGTVQLSSGTTPTLDFYGDGLINIAVNGQTLAQAIDPSTGKPLGAAAENSGTISANGGTVYITANVAAGVVDQTINVSGVVQAQSVSQQNGEIVLNGGSTGAVQVAGTLDASGTGRGETGGTVKVLGNTVALASNSTINVSGDAGGGTVDVGGDFHGAGPDPNANTTTVDQGATILADAVTSGNGGDVAVWSQQSTSFDGAISAKGGSQSGNGGQVETSGADLSVGNDALVNTSAPAGTTGDWLLDPAANLYINSSGTVPSTDPSASAIANTTVNTDLGTTNVTEKAGNDLLVVAPISWSSGSTLTLDAGHDIIVEAPITHTYAGTGGGLAFTFGQSTGVLSPGDLAGGSLYIFDSSETSNLNGVVTLDAAHDSLTINGASYTLITSLVGMSLTGNYALDTDLNCTVSGSCADFSDQTLKGSFEGLGHTISSLTVDSSTATTGIALFGTVSGAGVVRNVGLLSPNIQSSNSATATVDMGTVAAINRGSIVNVWVNNATITSNPTTAPNQAFEGVGGLVGVNTGLIDNSFADGVDITSYAQGAGSGPERVYALGGVVGANLANDGLMVGSYAESITLHSTSVSGQPAYLGGFVGYDQGEILADALYGATTPSLT
ncbi:MAG: filamentous hemagglutinin N-terminal domain-containing protein, partial [Gemmataceae bacterium]